MFKSYNEDLSQSFKGNETAEVGSNFMLEICYSNSMPQIGTVKIHIFLSFSSTYKGQEFYYSTYNQDFNFFTPQSC